MRKILFILTICLSIMLSIISCNKYDKEEIEFAKQFNLLENIDTINLVHIDAKAFQIIDEWTCLAKENGYLWGDIIFIFTDDLLYDNVILNDEFILLGTFQYTAEDSTHRTVKAYSSKDFYIKYNKIFTIIKEIKNNNYVY